MSVHNVMISSKQVTNDDMARMIAAHEQCLRTLIRIVEEKPKYNAEYIQYKKMLNKHLKRYKNVQIVGFCTEIWYE
jgi:signal transduction histidine kinase